MSDADFTPLRVTYRTHSRETFSHMRTWAKATGYPVSDRGRVAREIIDAFFAARPEVYERADTFELVHATARTPGASPDDYEWQNKDDCRLGEIYTIVFVRGLGEHEVLHLLGVADEHIRLIEDEDWTYQEGSQLITVRRLGDWTVVIEDHGWRGARWEVLEALSRDGGEAVAVLRHDYAQDHLAHAVDGHVTTDINPGYPDQMTGHSPE